MARPGFILTKIIATLGPATADPKTIRRMIEEGVRVFRINFSHASFSTLNRFLEFVRAAAKDLDVPVGVLGDLSGPKIRVGQVRGDGLELLAGATVEFEFGSFVAEPAPPGASTLLAVSMPQAVTDVEVGHRIFIDDGAIRMLAIDKKTTGGGERLVCRVLVGGPVTTSKGINLPDSTLTLPSLTDYDRKCVQWSAEHGIDWLALSFVRRSDDVIQLKIALKEPAAGGTSIPVIAKIEKPAAIGQLEAIVRESDGVMVARGDLGVEMDLAMVPVIQKRIIRMAHDHGKPVIVATQMLQSMIQSASPTRAEVSDVANAIYDGADAVMLSGETAVGTYPIQSIMMMARVARVTLEQMIADGAPAAHQSARQLAEGRYRTAALARGVAAIVQELDAKLVVTWSQGGGGARYLSKNRLAVPVIAASNNMAALQRMSLLYGVIPILMSMPPGREAFASKMDELIQEWGWATAGDPIVLVAGEPLGAVGVTNTVWVRYLGDACVTDVGAQGEGRQAE